MIGPSQSSKPPMGWGTRLAGVIGGLVSLVMIGARQTPGGGGQSMVIWIIEIGAVVGIVLFMLWILGVRRGQQMKGRVIRARPRGVVVCKLCGLPENMNEETPQGPFRRCPECGQVQPQGQM
jgi:hypothetical protein